MEVKDLKDFYIDLDGDIKASAGDAKTAVFITNSDKPSSQYVMAENIDQIKSAIKQINSDYDLDFEILKIEYPQLIHKFKHYEVITEITIREKQRAVGVQPMLYFCFPITELISDTHLIGRCANLKEFADFKINKDNSFIIVEMIKIFGMLSPSHKHDTIEIIDLVIKSL